MKIHDIKKYNEAKKKVKELSKINEQLDKVADILYDNISNNDIWVLIQHLEEIRAKYYVQYYDYSKTLENKGEIDVEE